MFHLNSKYSKVLVVLSILLSVSFQLVWLNQLFQSRMEQTKEDLENMVSTTVQSQWFAGITALENKSQTPLSKKFFLSHQWQDLRNALNNMKTLGIPSYLKIQSEGDSTLISINLKLNENEVINKSKSPVTSGTGLSNDQLTKIDSLTLINIKNEVRQKLSDLNYSGDIFFRVYSYNSAEVISDNIPKGQQLDYVSKSYMYGIQNHYRYQLCLPSLNLLVAYRMRFYLISSILLTILTIIAFYFILKLIRNIQFYTDIRSDFTRNMTHELKLPISTVSVALESIHKYNLTEQPETLKNYVDISLQELNRLNLMVEKVLQIDGGGNIPFQTELYDLQTGLEKVVEVMKFKLNDTSEINFNPSSEPCFVMGDPVHLTNIFYNLIENAIKYAKGSLRMNIDCNCIGNEVVLSFSDDGPGIDKMYHKSIFEKFFRIPEKGDVHTISGSGLGLYYVKNMIERHKGKIKVKSELGEGTCFLIHLKRVL